MEIEKFIKSLARKAKLGGRYSTANTYLYTLHSFQKFAGKASLTFEEITPEYQGVRAILNPQRETVQHDLALHAHVAFHLQSGIGAEHSFAQHPRAV